MPTEDLVLSECNANLVKAFEYVANSIPGGRVEHVGGTCIVRTGVPGFDQAFAFEQPESLREISDSIEEIYAGSGITWTLVTTPSTTESMMPLIRQKGLAQTREGPGMLLDPLPNWRPFPPSSLQIRTVTGREEMRTLVDIMRLGFGMPPKGLEHLADAIVAGIENGNFKGGCYLGYLHGKPAATSMRLTSGRVAGVYSVATLPEFRGRGVGKAMTWKAAVDGREEGCVMSFLQASDMGRPIYERMGYRTIVNYHFWWKPAAVASAKKAE